MATVTERIQCVKQPYGGYIRLSDFRKIKGYDNGVELNTLENVSPSLIGAVVEYLTRSYFFTDHFGYSVEEGMTKAFEVSLRGAMVAERYFGVKGAVDVARKLFVDMVGSSNREIIITNVLKLATFDVWYRNPYYAKPGAYEAVNPNTSTVENVHTMIIRSVRFFEWNGPMTSAGFDFSPSGYTATVDKGDGDFLTRDTLWDMKVYKGRLTSKHTLQVLMYWIMGQHSGQEIFNGVTKIGLYNPRENVGYVLDVSKIPADVIREVENKVIRY